MHPGWLRCSSVTGREASSLVTPCHPGASAPVFAHLIQIQPLTVQFVLGLLGHGASVREILDEYPGLVDDDIRACLLFASESVGSASFVPLVPDAA